MGYIRIDRAVSIRLMGPARGLLDRRNAVTIPILMYHGIRNETRPSHPYFGTCTPPAVFQEQMQFLALKHYSTLSIEEGVGAIRKGVVAAKPVIITFDDGYRDFYAQAFPVLAQYGFKATAFVVAGFTENENVSREGQEYMSWSELREISAHGIEVGSHTMTHPRLQSLPGQQIQEELERSRWTLEDRLGNAVRSFAYPFAFPEHDGQFVRNLRDLLQASGYREGVTTIIGRAHRNHEEFFLPRLPVNSHDDLRLFEAKLQGGYDWLHAVQFTAKWLKAKRF